MRIALGLPGIYRTFTIVDADCHAEPETMIHDPIKSDAATGRTERAMRRQPVSLLAKLRQRGAKPLEVEVHDLSTHGFQVDTVHVIRPCALVWIQFPGFGPLEAEVRWFREYRIGCAFKSPLHPAVFATITAQAR